MRPHKKLNNSISHKMKSETLAAQDYGIAEVLQTLGIQNVNRGASNERPRRSPTIEPTRLPTRVEPVAEINGTR